MDRIDDMLTRYFAAGAEPPRRALRPSVDPAGLLAALADRIGIEAVYRICAFLPLIGVLAAFLPDPKTAGEERDR